MLISLSINHAALVLLLPAESLILSYPKQRFADATHSNPNLERNTQHDEGRLLRWKYGRSRIRWSSALLTSFYRPIGLVAAY